ncbi:MAG: helix-turn-helix domain-containing protein [Puniceicoccales bacterium]|nr:helix-turn-helix domain-containing protein [Puniceicoccales bacterium]
MSTPDDFPKRPDDFPWPTPMHPLEFARLLYEKEKELENQDSGSPAVKPFRFGGSCTYLTRREAAEYLRMSPKTLQNCPKNIPYYKIGERVLYIKEELDDIIRNNKQGGES